MFTDGCFKYHGVDEIIRRQCPDGHFVVVGDGKCQVHSHHSMLSIILFRGCC